MKYILSLFFCLILLKNSFAQTALTGVSISNVTNPNALTYTNSTNTYNWAVGANNIQKRILGFSSPTANFSYSNALNGIVKMRRINNAVTTGDFTLVWSEGTITATPFNMQANMPANMEVYFDDNIFNKGTDNLFDNTSTNSNNIERLDWILSGGYSTTKITKIGFAVFERGVDNNHDAFAIAAITGLDAMGNPNNYGTLKKVTTAEWGNITSSTIDYRILKGASGTNLLDAGVNTQPRGGIFFSLSDLGIAANEVVYGYSLFASDVPATSTDAQLSDVSATNTTTYPTNTGTAGGIDLIATTGIFSDITALPITLESFSIKQTNTNNLSWKISDDNNELLGFEIQKSIDGINFSTIGNVPPIQFSSTYSFIDNNNSSSYFYRIKINSINGSYFFSSIIKVTNDKKVKTILYPNPINISTSLTFYSKENTETILNIYDVTGKKISSEKVITSEGINALKPKFITELKAGQYILTIATKDSVIESITFIKY